jgi:phosphoribosylformimino-5-aminoimidazole carboxamide ribotide isomerase
VFEVVPAVDIARGDVVRLREGDLGRRTVYGSDPAEAARRWVREGARRLHVVDLDGAFGGRGAPLDLLRRIGSLGVPVQAGGGIRDAQAASARRAAGASEVVVGSLLRSPQALGAFVREVGPERILLALDVRAGRLQVEGWRRSADLAPLQALELGLSLGVRRFLVTAVERDGTERGPDFRLLERFLRSGAEVLASGGVASLEGLRRLKERGLRGAIVGRALYERRFSLAQAMEVAAC